MAEEKVNIIEENAVVAAYCLRDTHQWEEILLKNLLSKGRIIELIQSNVRYWRAYSRARINVSIVLYMQKMNVSKRVARAGIKKTVMLEDLRAGLKKPNVEWNELDDKYTNFRRDDYKYRCARKKMENDLKDW